MPSLIPCLDLSGYRDLSNFRHRWVNFGEVLRPTIPERLSGAHMVTDLITLGLHTRRLIEEIFFHTPIDSLYALPLLQ